MEFRVGVLVFTIACFAQACIAEEQCAKAAPQVFVPYIDETTGRIIYVLHTDKSVPG